MLNAARSSETLRSALQSIESDELKEDLKEIAHQMDLMGLSAGEALPQLQAGIGGRLVADLEAINRAIERSGEFVPGSEKLPEFIDLVSRAVDQGVVLDKVFGRAGKDVGDFFFLLDAITASDTVEGMGDIGSEVQNMAHAYSEAVSIVDKFNEEQQAVIDATALNQQATEKYAQELGVSSEFLRAHLDAVGVSAVGMSDETKDAFEALEFTVNEKTRRVSARVTEMQEALAEAAGKMSESIAESFLGFEKADEPIKAGTDKLLSIFRTNAQAVINEVANLQTLAARGVPTDVLQFLADQGPQFVSKFVNASDQELRRLVTLYQAQMAAVDATILRESAHQGGKGAGMVDSFVNGILSNSQLPPQAAARIVRSTVDAFGRGDISAKGLDLARRFAQGLGTVKGLTRQQGAAALTAFIQEITRRDLTKIGAQEAEEIARGLVAEGVPKQKARELVAKVTDEAKTAAQSLGPFAGKLLAQKYSEGVASGKPLAGQGGKGVAQAASAGLRSGSAGAIQSGIAFASGFVNSLSGYTGIAYDRAHALGAAAKQGLDDGLQGSPMYYSFYAGEEFVRQFDEGMKNMKNLTQFPHPDIRFPLGSQMQGRQDGHRPRPRSMDLDLDVTIDRARAARAMDWEYATRGV